MTNEQRDIIELRHLEAADYMDLCRSMKEAYAGMGGICWGEKHIGKLLEIFPEGQLAIAINGKVVGCALSIIVNYDEIGDTHTYKQIHGNFTFNSHDPKGDVLYGIEMFVDPAYRGLRLGRRLYEGRKALCENLNLRAIMAGGRIPNYQHHEETHTPRQYIEAVQAREIYDPTLTFQLANGFHVKRF